jgi:hypothetical protein
MDSSWTSLKSSRFSEVPGNAPVNGQVTENPVFWALRQGLSGTAMHVVLGLAAWGFFTGDCLVEWRWSVWASSALLFFTLTFQLASEWHVTPVHPDCIQKVHVRRVDYAVLVYESMRIGRRGRAVAEKQVKATVAATSGKMPHDNHAPHH